jgi:hypothetical protein
MTLKNFFNIVPTVFVFGLFSLLSESAVADAYGFLSEDGTIYLTDNDEGKHYELLGKEPQIESHKFSLSGEQTTPIIFSNKLQKNRSYINEVNIAAKENHLDSKLLQAIIAVESDYNPRAVSSKGAVGLMQLMPATAKRFGVVDLYDPQQNILGGARYLAYLLRLFNNNKRLAIAAYNSGEQSVITYGWKVPPYRETLIYVSRVVTFFEQPT